MVDDLRRLRRLTSGQRVRFVQAALLVRGIRVALSLSGLGPVQRVLARLCREPRINGIDPRAAQVRTIAWAAAAAGRRAGTANCLPQSLALWWLLRREGFAADLHFGVRKVNAGLDAHAWVQLGAHVLIDGNDVRAEFTPFDRAIAAAPVRAR
jgi:hypothetical protein